MEEKEIAVVITAYNAGECLDLTINSLLESTTHPLKIIIIESASTDGTAEKCDEYTKDKRFKVIHNKEREGVTKAVNRGIKEAGDLDVFLTHADVIFPKKYKADWLKEMIELSKIKECGIVTCYGGGNTSGKDYLDGFNYVGSWAMFLPRKTIKKIGLWDEDFEGPGDDIDYSYRVMLAKLKIGLIEYWVDHHRKLRHHTDKDVIKGDLIIDKIARNGLLFKKKWGLI